MTELRKLNLEWGDLTIERINTQGTVRVRLYGATKNDKRHEVHFEMEEWGLRALAVAIKAKFQELGAERDRLNAANLGVFRD